MEQVPDILEIVSGIPAEDSVSSQELVILAVLASLIPEDGIIVEVGTNHGRTAALLHHFSDATLHTIDCRQPYPFCVPREANFIKGKSVEVARSFQDQGIDLLFIDGHHSKEDAKLDYESWYPKVKVGGCIVIHDVYFNHYYTNGTTWYFKEHISPEISSYSHIGGLVWFFKNEKVN
jgi:predicted O-methyltransferase YrrM